MLIVQMGHCYRTSGATGTQGEQGYATVVAEACMALLHGVDGWIVRRTLADENYYRADAFAAIHCDGSLFPGARGSSVGYRTPEGQAFGQAFKRAYANRGWPVFRPDNYTDALHGYYGVRNAVNAGTRRAIIIECGFRTNAEDRALLDGPVGPERVALSIGDALGITTPITPKDDEDMMYLLQGGSGAPTYNNTNVYLLSGPFLQGLTGDSRADAIDAINRRGAQYLWVTAEQLTDIDKRSHALYDNGAAVDALKMIVNQLSVTNSLLGGVANQLSEDAIAVRSKDQT